MSWRPGETSLKVGVVNRGSELVDGHESRILILLVDRKSSLLSERQKSVSAKRKSAEFSASENRSESAETGKRSELAKDVSRSRSGISSRKKLASGIAAARWMTRRNVKCISDDIICTDGEIQIGAGEGSDHQTDMCIFNHCFSTANQDELTGTAFSNECIYLNSN